MALWLRRLSLLTVLYLLTSGTTQAAQNKTEAAGRPQLRVETGGHTSTVRGLLFITDPQDADNKCLISAGRDLTVRFWHLNQSGTDLSRQALTPMQTFRYVNGADQKGEILCMAYDEATHRLALGTKAEGGKGQAALLIVDASKPDRLARPALMEGSNALSSAVFNAKGSLLAVGDSTGHINVYDTSSWAVSKRLTIRGSDEDTDVSLVFSPDGSQLAAARGTNVTVWDAAAWKGHNLPGTGPDAITCLAWAAGPKGLLAAGDKAGHLSFWRNGQRQNPAINPNRVGVKCLAFDTQGINLAIGLDGTETEIGQVAVWSEEGGSQATPLKASTPVTAVTFLKDEQVIATGDESGEIRLWPSLDGGQPSVALSGQGRPTQDIRWSKNSDLITFNLYTGPQLKMPFAFDLNNMTLLPGVPDKEQMAGPLNRLSRDKDTQALTLLDVDNKTVVTWPPELSISKSVYDPKYERVYLALTNGLIQEYDVSRRGPAVPCRRFGGYKGVILSLSVSPDGRYLAAGSPDQLVRLWSLGAEAVPNHAAELVEPLLCLFVGQESNWIVWNPQTGYYYSTVGGDNIVQWQITDATPSQPAYICYAEQFKETFKSEECLQRLFREGTTQYAINQLATSKHGSDSLQERMLKVPVIKTVEVANATRDVNAGIYTTGNGTILLTPHLEAADLANGIDFRVIPQGGGRAVKVHLTGPKEIEVPLTPGLNRMSVQASNQYGNSQLYPVKVDYHAPPGTETKGDLYVLSIGINNYKEAVNKLNYARKDAEDVAACFKQQEGRVFANVQTSVLTDEGATKKRIENAIEKLKDDTTVKPNDTLVLFMAGHGAGPEESGVDSDYFFVPQDATFDNLKDTGVSWNRIVTILEQVKAKNIVLFIDHCFAGGVNKALLNPGAPGSAGTKSDTKGKILDTLKAKGNIVTFVAAAPNEESYEDEKWGHGAFTYELLRVLRGEAEDSAYRGYVHSRALTLQDITSFGMSQVAHIVKEQRGAAQNPPVPAYLGSNPEILTIPIAQPFELAKP